MKISIASDHGGFKLKSEVIEKLKNDYDFIDEGTYDEASTDYPIYASKVALDVQKEKASFGVLICTTGIGMSISANKFKNIRAALVLNHECAKLSREHNDANIICLGSKFVTLEEACDYINTFINSSFQAGRHARRVSLIKTQEE